VERFGGGRIFYASECLGTESEKESGGDVHAGIQRETLDRASGGKRKITKRLVTEGARPAYTTSWFVVGFGGVNGAMPGKNYKRKSPVVSTTRYVNYLRSFAVWGGRGGGDDRQKGRRYSEIPMCLGIVSTSPAD